MYAASLTCQSWTAAKGLTMGFTDKQGVTAASVMLMLPCTVGAKLRSVCGTDWPATDGIMPILFMAGGLLLLHLASPTLGAMVVIRVLGSLVFVCAFFIAGRWDVYSVVAMALGASALLAEVWRTTTSPPPPPKAGHTNKHKA